MILFYLEMKFYSKEHKELRIKLYPMHEQQYNTRHVNNFELSKYKSKLAALSALFRCIARTVIVRTVNTRFKLLDKRSIVTTLIIQV